MKSTTARAAQDLLKVLPILPDTNVRRHTIDAEDQEPQWKSEKR